MSATPTPEIDNANVLEYDVELGFYRPRRVVTGLISNSGDGFTVIRTDATTGVVCLLDYGADGRNLSLTRITPSSAGGRDVLHYNDAGVLDADYAITDTGEAIISLGQALLPHSGGVITLDYSEEICPLCRSDIATNPGTRTTDTGLHVCPTCGDILFSFCEECDTYHLRPIQSSDR
jgi:hypothetical protein